MNAQFGTFVRERRTARGLSLRQFAKACGMQPSNYCNVESGSLPPPPAATVERMAEPLGLTPGTEDYAQLLDLAAKERDEIPADVARIVKERDAIPALLRTVENENVTEKQLRGIIEELRSGSYKKAD